MELKLERFTKTGGSFAPMVSIRKHGSFGISQGALHRFNLLEGDWFVILYFDKSANVIGIQRTKESQEEGVIKLIKRKSKAQKSAKESVSASIAARAFFEYYNISCEKTRTFHARWDEKLQMILVHLNEEVEATASEEEGGDPEEKEFAHSGLPTEVGNNRSVGT